LSQKIKIMLEHLNIENYRLFKSLQLDTKNNILLIDEIDLGLHHSIQKKLWEIIFKFSKELNVQVFATTHSHDCVETFAEVWNNDSNKNDGNYIRLQRNRLNNDIIEPVYYNEKILLGSIYDNLETR
jgi:AAA15 family ATPase/GTPase